MADQSYRRRKDGLGLFPDSELRLPRRHFFLSVTSGNCGNEVDGDCGLVRA